MSTHLYTVTRLSEKSSPEIIPSLFQAPDNRTHFLANIVKIFMYISAKFLIPCVCVCSCRGLHYWAHFIFYSGAFIPRCNDEGYYKATQCHGSTGQCWCVDKYGNEIAGSRKQGTVSCEEEQETSGDFGSGGSVVLLDDLEEEPEATKKDKEGKLKIHVRAANEDDEDEDDDKDDEIGYIW